MTDEYFVSKGGCFVKPVEGTAADTAAKNAMANIEGVFIFHISPYCTADRMPRIQKHS
jgi:hypothetical protein